MSADEKYQGWTNRETWAVALHINNDQGWQESVHEALRSRMREADAYARGTAQDDVRARWAGEAIRENVETLLDPSQYRDEFDTEQEFSLTVVAHEVGSLWRVNWTELGAAFLADLEEGVEDQRYTGGE